MNKQLIIEFKEQDERFLLEFLQKMKINVRPVESESEILARLSPEQQAEWVDLKEALMWSEKQKKAETKNAKSLQQLLKETRDEHRQQSDL